MCDHTHDGQTTDGRTDEHDRGLGYDLETLRSLPHRRSVLGLIGGGALALGGSAALVGQGAATSAATAAPTAACAQGEIPAETAGPYPGDGSNGPDVLEETGVVRRDIRRSFGGADGRATGVALRVTMVLRDTDACAPAQGLAVYAWHCDAQGRYSMYTSGVEDENFLRGVQVSNARGRVRFTTIFPGCYPGRWPHVHFEVYRSRAAATGGGTPLATSQLALPRAESVAVYRADDRYEGSETNLNRISLGSDSVFGDDGGVRQLATVKGSVDDGYRARLVVPVDL